jgi:putative transposase
MLLDRNHIYHIYNQGNNKQKIFFSEDNYLFFLQKMKSHLLPYVDIMAWCLMPNHFHWMIYVREVEACYKSGSAHTSGSATESRAPTSGDEKKIISLNHSIGILLASYTRAIQKQEGTSGSLFRDKTKAECVTKFNGITPSFYNSSQGTYINIPNPEKEYPQICFRYIHDNPVKAKLVTKVDDWEFSSFRDICGLRNGTLINKERIKEFGLHLDE